jgi:3-deoxy-D-manno-octulosonic-acid transferase
VPVVFGPFVWNFRDAAERLIEANAAVKVTTPEQMHQQLLRMLDDDNLRRQMSEAARNLVVAQQGATQRTLDVMDVVIAATKRSERAAA